LTGITFPFVSYGGSSLLASFVVVGLLLSISHRSSIVRPEGAGP
jgi:cell division protein FtsW